MQTIVNGAMLDCYDAAKEVMRLAAAHLPITVKPAHFAYCRRCKRQTDVWAASCSVCGLPTR